MNVALACIAVMAMLTAQTLSGASLADVKLDMKEMDSLVKVYSHTQRQMFVNDHHMITLITSHAVMDVVLIGSTVGSGVVIGIIMATVAVCICYLLYHSYVTKSMHYR